MVRVVSMLATAALLFSVDLSAKLRTTPPGQFERFSSRENSLVPQGSKPAEDQTKAAPKDSPDHPDQPAKAQPGPLQATSRLSLVRYVDGEIVQLVRSIPAGKKGFPMKPPAPPTATALPMPLASPAPPTT